MKNDKNHQRKVDFCEKMSYKISYLDQRKIYTPAADQMPMCVSGQSGDGAQACDVMSHALFWPRWS